MRQLTFSCCREDFKMALTYSKKLYFQLKKYGNRNLFPILGNNFPNILSVVHYSDMTKEASTTAISKAMKLHLERAKQHDKFIKDQLAEYELGKQFLSNMMGKKTGKMTEKEVDEAIEYLFPSALFVPKSRPMMKPPEVLFPKQKEAVFDATGRPLHFLFYTCKPNFCQCLHDAASVLESLNKKMLRDKSPPQPLSLVGGRWLMKEELEKLFFEKLYDIEYEKFLVLFERLGEHPWALTAENFIKKYWKAEEVLIQMEVPKPAIENTDVKVFKIEGLRKKSTFAEVTLTHPGTGKIEINNSGMDYFNIIERRREVSGRSEQKK